MHNNGFFFRKPKVGEAKVGEGIEAIAKYRRTLTKQTLMNKRATYIYETIRRIANTSHVC